jgi:sulfur carrier protein
LGWQPFVPDPDNAGVGKRNPDYFHSWPLSAAICVCEASAGAKMKITVNGEELAINPNTVLGYLVEIGLDPRRVAVELNMDILEKGEYATTMLNEGDRVEIVHFVGGG